MTTDVLGERIKRVEDPRFITGNGNFLDDIKLASMTHMAILRSPYAHANIRSIDVSAAKAMPGVLGVFVGADIPYNPLPMAWPAGGSAGIHDAWAGSVCRCRNDGHRRGLWRVLSFTGRQSNTWSC